MKAKNMFFGQRVQIKSDRTNQRGFSISYLGRVGTITTIELGGYYDVRVEFDDGHYDWGNHSGIRKVKEA